MKFPVAFNHIRVELLIQLLREFADNTKIADARGNYSDDGRPRRHLLVGYRHLIDLYQKGIERNR